MRELWIDPHARGACPKKPRRRDRSLAQNNVVRYDFPVGPEEKHEERKLWKPHPDDEAEVNEALESADRGEVLSPEASEAFLRWLEGSDDESWRDECE
jgi:hypothetical protein